MRALTATGLPGRLTRVTIVDDPAPGPHDAVVRVGVFSLNRPDFLYLGMPGATYRPGIDAVGVVERAAVDGTGPATGERVVVHLPGGGAAAERIAVPASRLVPVPPEVDSATAACLPLAGMVALRLLRAAGPLPGRRLLATGAGGGVGTFLVRLATADGARVTVYAPPGAPSAHLRSLGAEVVHDLGALPAGTFDVVLESMGGDIGSATAAKLRTGGLLLWYGQASARPLTLDFFSLLSGGRSLTLHHFVHTHAETAEDADIRDIRELLRLAADGTLRPEIGHRSDWEETAGVLEDMAAGRLRGKAVLSIP